MRKSPNELDTDVALKIYIIIGFMVAALIGIYFVLNKDKKNESDTPKDSNVTEQSNSNISFGDEKKLNNNSNVTDTSNIVATSNNAEVKKSNVVKSNVTSNKTNTTTKTTTTSNKTTNTNNNDNSTLGSFKGNYDSTGKIYTFEFSDMMIGSTHNYTGKIDFNPDTRSRLTIDSVGSAINEEGSVMSDNVNYSQILTSEEQQLIKKYFTKVNYKADINFIYAYKDIMLGARKCTDSDTNKEVYCRDLGVKELKNLINK